MSDVTVLTSDGRVHGYLAVPRGEGPWPAAVVLHESYGFGADIRSQADRLAAAGYLAYAPDLFTRGPKALGLARSARELRTRRGRTFDDIDAVRRWLAGRPDCTGRVGVIGFALGGSYALLAAKRGFEAAAVNYGQVPKRAVEVLPGSCPIVASYGGRDGSLRDAARQLDRVLNDLGVPHDVKEYPRAGHGFLNHHELGATRRVVRAMSATGLRETEATDAWKRIIGFFGGYLGAPVPPPKEPEPQPEPAEKQADEKNLDEPLASAPPEPPAGSAPQPPEPQVSNETTTVAPVAEPPAASAPEPDPAPPKPRKRAAAKTAAPAKKAAAAKSADEAPKAKRASAKRTAASAEPAEKKPAPRKRKAAAPADPDAKAPAPPEQRSADDAPSVSSQSAGAGRSDGADAAEM